VRWPPSKRSAAQRLRVVRLPDLPQVGQHCVHIARRVPRFIDDAHYSRGRKQLAPRDCHPHLGQLAPERVLHAHIGISEHHHDRWRSRLASRARNGVGTGSRPASGERRTDGHSDEKRPSRGCGRSGEHGVPPRFRYHHITLPPGRLGVSSPGDPALPLRERFAVGWLLTTARTGGRHFPSGRRSAQNPRRVPPPCEDRFRGLLDVVPGNRLP